MTISMPRFDTDAIRRYYDRHTPTFVSRGQGGAQGALHRAVWGPGVTTREQAFHYVDDRLADLIHQAPPTATPHVVDLGCGVGGSLAYLAHRLPISATGVTMSVIQAAAARQRLAAAGMAHRVSVIEADFTNLPPDVPPAVVAFGIESFVHAPDPGAFFAQASRILVPGGLLVLCDDFRRPSAEPRAARAIDRFCRGWHVNSLLDSATLARLAESTGLEAVEHSDLTPYLEIGRPRDRVLAAAAAVLERLPWRWPGADPWMGGTALQACLRHGWIGYDLVVFRKR